MWELCIVRVVRDKKKKSRLCQRLAYLCVYLLLVSSTYFGFPSCNLIWYQLGLGNGF